MPCPALQTTFRGVQQIIKRNKLYSLITNPILIISNLLICHHLHY
jgi:hypothetical protein